MHTQIASLWDITSSFESRFNGSAPTFEAIDFQINDKVGAEIEKIVGEFKTAVDNGARRKDISGLTDLMRKLDKVTFDRFGLKTHLVTNSHLAAVMPVYITKENSMITDQIKKAAVTYGFDLTAKEAKRLKDGMPLGKVSDKDARVSGWMSEVEFPIYMDMYALFKDFKMSTAEVTAIYLHEVGHGFDSFSFADRTHTANHVLMDLAVRMADKGNRPDADYIFRELKKVDPKVEKDIAVGLASGQGVVMGVSLFRFSIGAMSSLMGDRVYDRVSFESLSDNFAARFGYGSALISGLEKLDPDNSFYDFQRANSFAFSIALGYTFVATLLGLFCVFTGAVVLGVMVTAMYGLLFKILFSTTGSEGQFRQYDDIINRYKRIRNVLVEQIKTGDMTKEQTKGVLEEIRMADEIILTKKVYTPWYDSFSDFFFSKDRRGAASIRDQQKLEEMIANQIFVKAAELQQLA